MTTFVLKKYDNSVQSPNSESNSEIKPTEEVTIKVEGSVAEIVASALQRVLANKVNIQEVEDNQDTENTEQVKAISTEEINKDPIKAFNAINKQDIVFIQNKGFKTSTEEWFLLNIPNKTNTVFYTIESLLKHVCAKLDVAYV